MPIYFQAGFDLITRQDFIYFSCQENTTNLTTGLKFNQTEMSLKIIEIYFYHSHIRECGLIHKQIEINNLLNLNRKTCKA